MILLRVRQQTSFLSCSCNYWYISSLIATWCIDPMLNIHYTGHYRYHIPETHWVKDKGSCWSPQWQKPLPEQSGSSLYLTWTEDTRIFKGAVFWMSTISHIFTSKHSVLRWWHWWSLWNFQKFKHYWKKFVRGDKPLDIIYWPQFRFNVLFIEWKYNVTSLISAPVMVISLLVVMPKLTWWIVSL